MKEDQPNLQSNRTCCVTNLPNFLSVSPTGDDGDAGGVTVELVGLMQCCLEVGSWGGSGGKTCFCSLPHRQGVVKRALSLAD